MVDLLPENLGGAEQLRPWPPVEGARVGAGVFQLVDLAQGGPPASGEMGDQAVAQVFGADKGVPAVPGPQRGGVLPVGSELPLPARRPGRGREEACPGPACMLENLAVHPGTPLGTTLGQRYQRRSQLLRGGDVRPE
ncbi:hypothetical protein [Rhodococcus sp. JS3073]|uniref:hypothetical protein n=1 Tax=Rhodococcus sp. JS3073 TaxID=3002901 RepID=UPI002286B66A|nr:hypothetical protein [Rhodococcus sp. JS3073]WAM19705.1 hypothetical protein OYT95_39300 [Rhodococcus sp. JS3073]